LEQLHFADEIRPADDIRPKRTKVDQRELNMAGEMIDSLRSSFEPERYHDTYRTALLEVIKAKQKGEVREAPPEEEREEPADLLEALRASVQAAKQQRSTRGPSRRKAASGSRRGSSGRTRRTQRKRTRA
jgi:DNA end-binding protein Ku